MDRSFIRVSPISCCSCCVVSGTKSGNTLGKKRSAIIFSVFWVSLRIAKLQPGDDPESV